jgi:hypothetical protein
MEGGMFGQLLQVLGLGQGQAKEVVGTGLLQLVAMERHRTL